jgi:hypothetical protein
MKKKARPRRGTARREEIIEEDMEFYTDGRKYQKGCNSVCKVTISLSSCNILALRLGAAKAQENRCTCP